MMAPAKSLPLRGRWQRKALTKGAGDPCWGPSGAARLLPQRGWIV